MDLQIVLLVLGVLLLIIVFVLNQFPDILERGRKMLSQKREQIKRSAKASSRGSKKAPAMNKPTGPTTERLAPSFDASGESVPGDDNAQNPFEYEDNDSEASISEASSSDHAERVAVEEEDEIMSLKELDEKTVVSGPFANLRQIDYWIKLTPATPKKQSEIFRHIGEWRDSKETLQLHALTQENPHWENFRELHPDTTVVDVVASYQLLTGGEAVSLAELIKFDKQATALGLALGANKLTMATPDQAIAQSTKLANFYEAHRTPLEVSVCAPQEQAFMGKLVETSAKQQGLEFFQGEYVRLKRMGAQNVLLYRMVDARLGYFEEDMPSNKRIEVVTFTMLPALSRSPGRDAKEMLDAAKAFASRVKGNIRVPGVREFHLDQLVQLRTHVSKLEKEMIEAGLEPGGQEIRRIFL